jgi:hypothetical protein
MADLSCRSHLQDKSGYKTVDQEAKVKARRALQLLGVVS